MISAEQHAQELGEASIQYREHPFLLKSGIRSHLFVDLREGHADPRRLKNTGRLILAATEGMVYDTVAGTGVDGGMVVGGVQFAVEGERELAGYRASDKRTGYSAEQDPKNGWGFRRKWVEGRRVLAVEGTLTSGGSLLTLADMIREAGGIITAAAVVVDRSNGGIDGIAKLLGKHPDTNEVLKIHTLFTLDEQNKIFVPSIQGPALSS